MGRPMRIRKSLVILAVLCLAPAVAWACSVPVFRYALEHWQPDAYRVVVYHAGEWGAAEQELADWLKAQPKQSGANVEFQALKLGDDLSPEDQARWDALPEEQRQTPRMLVQLPGRTSARIGLGEGVIGTAEWNQETLQRLVHSPARTEIGKRLVDGEVVWVFLESAQPEADDALFSLLEEQVKHKQSTLKLPTIEEEDLPELSGSPADLKIQFSTLRISRDDPAEKWFVDMLLSVESDLRDEDVVDQAMVFPVFGRGRALYALVGPGINADTIGQAATFLTGACQCTVKAENPGVDLLIPVQWDNLIQKSEPEEMELSLVGLGGGVPLDSESDQSAEKTTTSSQADFPAEEGGSVPSGQNGAFTADSASGAEAEPGSSNVLMVPLVVLILLGAVVGLLGTTMLRRD